VNRFRRTAAAIAASLCAGIAGAQPAPGALPANPPPPSAQTAEGVAPWINANIGLEGWLLAGANTATAILSPKAFVKTPQGKVELWVRIESFAPGNQQGFAWRSALQKLEFDCAASTGRIMEVMLFSGLNLQGGWQGITNTQGAAVPTASLGPMDAIREQACTAGRPQWPVTASALASQSRPAMFAWLAENVDVKDWRLSSLAPIGLIFTNPAVTTSSEGFRQARLRTEFFKPETGPTGAPRRSEITNLEVDCANGRVRVVSLTSHLQQNLTGQGQVIPAPPEWRPGVPGTSIGIISRGLCGAAWKDPPAAAPTR
jgi:hypothetical protein